MARASTRENMPAVECSALNKKEIMRMDGSCNEKEGCEKSKESRVRGEGEGVRACKCGVRSLLCYATSRIR